MNKGAAVLGMLGVAIGLMAGYVFFGERGTSPSVEAEQGKKPLFYRNPMNPEVTSPVPTRDSMGMDYIPVYEEAQAGRNPGTVEIDPVVQANIGLRTAIAEKKPMSRTIRAVGRVDYDEENLLRLHPKVEGWIRDIRINKTGETIADDEILLTIYSPKLVATQQEYLLALKNYEALKNSSFIDVREGAKSLMQSSRERLVLLDVPAHQIAELEQTRKIKEGLHIHAPVGGTVLEIGVRQGQFVSPATQLYLIADLSTVWVYADVYDYELSWVKEGDSVEMTLASVPGRTFRGRVSYIYPYAEKKTRTTKVRVIFDNPDGVLRPEMFAELSINVSEKVGQIVVPSESVVRSGDYDLIFVRTPEGDLEPRRVRLGVESGGEVVVESGIAPGERVVVSAQFLIDSESKLREAAAKMIAPDAPGQHSNHEGAQHD